MAEDVGTADVESNRVVPPTEMRVVPVTIEEPKLAVFDGVSRRVVEPPTVLPGLVLISGGEVEVRRVFMIDMVGIDKVSRAVGTTVVRVKAISKVVGVSRLLVSLVAEDVDGDRVETTGKAEVRVVT